MGSLVYLARAAWPLLLIIVLFGHLSDATTDQQEAQALIAFKSSVIDPNNNLGNWNPATDPCDSGWPGVLCTTFPGEQSKHVTELRLLNLNLSGHLGDELSSLQSLEYLDLMWNNFSGSIPASIGNLTQLKLLLLSGNLFTGTLPPALGRLTNMIRLQLDENQLSGPIPDSFTQLKSIKHVHLNNNSLNGSIPAGFGALQDLVHILLDSNQLNGTLPEDLARAPNLTIIQLDNNRFAQLPPAYAQIPTLVKLSLRNCGLLGFLPNFSQSTALQFLDLSNNAFAGGIPGSPLPENLSAMDLGSNRLNGSVPDSIGNLQALRYLELRNNQLSGEIPANLGTGRSFSENSTQASGRIVLDFQNNSLSLHNNTRLATLQSDRVVELWLSGNPAVCSAGNANSNPLCVAHTVAQFLGGDFQGPDSSAGCGSCESPYENAPTNDLKNCRCAVPITISYRLKSPSFTSFDVYESLFIESIAKELQLDNSQVKVKEYSYDPGPRVNIIFFLFPRTGDQFDNQTQVDWIYQKLLHWDVPDNYVFGPYEILQFTIPAAVSGRGSKGMSTGAIVAVAIAAVVVTSVCAAALTYAWMRKHGWDHKASAMAKRALLRGNTFVAIDVPGVKSYTFEEMVKATDNFHEKNLLGKGGYGKVYLGTLKDGTMIAVKRAGENSLQGSNEFETEILLMSRVHHRNLVGLLGYCQDRGEFYSRGEQMLVYEYMPNGNLRHHLDKAAKFPMDFPTRLRVALGAARGIQYLHTQANPPIFHRDIKAANILLDEKYNAKVSDFGLSKLAPTDVSFEGTNAGHVTTMVKGTFGYLDPDYFLTQKLTDKSDVYSYGVVLLEILTGLYPISQGKNIIREVNTAYKDGLTSEVVDSRIGPYRMKAMEAVIEVALACCKDDPEERPSMTEVLHSLEEVWKASFAETQSLRLDGASPRGLLTRWLPAPTDTEVFENDGTRQDAGSSSSSFGRKTLHISPR